MGEKLLVSELTPAKAYTTISRFEYWPGVAPGILVPLLLGMSSLDQLVSPLVIEMIILCILLYFSGFIINSLADRELDKKYETFKGGISEAVEFLGVAKVKRILALQVTVAVLLGLHIGITLQNPWILLLLGLGVLFGLGYSVDPFYFKVKGIWHAISLGSSAFFIPLMFIYLTVASTIEPLDVLLIFGLTIAHYSMTMANQAADHLEDQQEGVLSPTVRLGLQRTLQWSLIMTIIGVMFIMIIVGAMYVSTGYSLLFGLDIEGLPSAAVVLLLSITTVIIAIGYYIPVRGLRDLLNFSNQPIPIEKRMELIKARINYSSWQASGIIGIAVALGVLFAGSLYTPLMIQSDSITETVETTELDVNTLRISNVVVTPDSEDSTADYVDVTVRLSMLAVEEATMLSEVTAMVDAGTANFIFNTASGAFDSEGRVKVRVYLLGHNSTEIWYMVSLEYKGEKGSHTWNEPARSDLYIFDADIDITEGLLYDHITLNVKTFNAGPAREANTITLKIEWAPLTIDWYSNNNTINTQQVWDADLKRDILKDRFDDSNKISVYLYFDDKEFDMVEIRF